MRQTGQSGLNAAVLVAIIAGLIILYIIFLPGSERSMLLENKTGTTEQKSNVLLSVFPGTLSTSKGLESDKAISNIFLVETTNAKELEIINPFIVKNGWFDKKTKKIDFDLADPQNTDNVILVFIPKKRSGVLTIKLNDATVFESALISDTIEPVRLKKSSLKDKNSLDFSVSSVGAKFWHTNEYSFDNIKIIGDITDTSRQESTNLFTLSDSEYSSLNQATLKFIPYCSNVKELGNLDIFVNNKKLFSSVPVCDNAYKQSMPKSILNQGENNIVFKTNKGSYSVEQIKITLEFKEPTVKTYFFEVDKSTFKSIIDGKKNVLLSMKFIDNKKKTAKIDINGRFDNIETDKSLFTKNINKNVLAGNNYIRLDPLEDIEVVELKIELV